MKKILFVLAVSFFIFNINLNVKAASIEQEDVLYNNIEEPADVHILNTGNLIEYVDHMIFKTNNYSIEIKGKLIGCCDDGSITYVMHKEEGQNKITKIVRKDTKVVLVDKECDIRKIVYSNNRIYLFGFYNDFGIILEYSEDFELISNRMYLENTNITFYDAMFYQDKWYILGLKKGHCINSQVENIGDYDDVKTILLILDVNLNYQSIKYFNHFSSYEHAKLLDVYDNYLYYCFDVDGVKYLYKSDLTFTNNYLLDKSKWDEVLVDVNGDYLLFNNNNTLKMTSSTEELDLGTYNKIYKYLIKDGRLNIYHYNKNNLYVKRISEYHINKLEPIVITYQDGKVDFDKNLNDTKEIDIKSYFSEVEVICNSDFSKNVSGKYNIELLIVRPNHENIKLSSVVEIMPYVNVIDGGVYCTGHSLIFLGNGTLNDVKINSGHNIVDPGEYKLEISDNLGGVMTYNFIVVNNYYIRNNDNLDADIVTSPGNNLEIEIEVGDIEVLDIIVNKESVDFSQDGKKLKILLEPGNNSGVREFIINQIVTKSYEYNLEKKIIVNVLKQTPSINIVENNGDMPSFSIYIEDEEQTIKYLEIVLTKETIQSKYLYFFNQDCLIDSQDFDAGIIDIYLCFDVGDGNLKKDKLLSLDANIKELNNLLTFNSVIETENLKQIDIKINTKSIKKMNALLVNNQNIVGKYNVQNSYTSLIISVSLTIVIMICIVICLIVKKRRIKKA